MVKSYDRYVLSESFGVVCAPACNVAVSRDGRRAITGAFGTSCVHTAAATASDAATPEPLSASMESKSSTKIKISGVDRTAHYRR